MKVLVMGLRQGLCRALEQRSLDYILWSPKPVKSTLKASCIIEGPFAKDEEEFNKTLEKYNLNKEDITHVIAGSEEPVVYSSLIRKWLKIKRNPHSLILKCTDKLTMKKYLSEKGIKMTPFVDIKKCSSREELIDQLGLPLVIKARNSSGGRGVEFLEDISESYFNQLKKEARRLDLYCEGAIKGSEGSIESFIQDHEITFTNITQYYVIGHCNLIPAPFDEDLRNKLLSLNRSVISSLNIKWGMTHLEYYVTEDGILFGEVALRPPGGHIMDCMDLSYGEKFWDYFLSIELHEKVSKSFSLKEYSAAFIFHPGDGKVKKIEGEQRVKKLESIHKWRFKLKAGDRVSKREGVGNDTGYALLKNADPDKLIDQIDQIREELIIEFE